MKKITSLFCILLFAFCMMFSACTGCSNTNPEPATGYNYDEIVTADYDYIASQYNDFKFYEVDVLFKEILSNDSVAPEIESIQTVFQCGDTCVRILHSHGENDTIREAGFWLECMEMSAYNAVNFDSCMSIVEPYRSELKTRALTFRRVLAPPFPENGQYIFGTGILVVDSKDGHVESWKDEVPEASLSAEKPEVDTNVVE